MENRQLPVQLLPREVTWGVRYLLFQLAFLGSVILLLLQLLNLPADDLILDTVYFVINLGLVVLIFHNYLWQSIKHGLQHYIKLVIAAIVGYACYFLLSESCDMILEWIEPGFFNVNDASIVTYGRTHYLVTFIGVVLLVPLAEETLYRGLVFGLLQRKSRLSAYIISTLFFAFIHVMGYVGSFPPYLLLLCFVQYIPAGITLAGAYEYSGSILAPVLIHTAINAIAILTMR